jgi:glycosyltransferase involved in cell wall biosynthesis
MNRYLQVKDNDVVLIISNFLSAKSGTYSPSESLAIKLAEKGWNVITTSNKMHRALRFLDMLITVYRNRLSYEVALVDVFSGPSFVWAEAVSRLLLILNKPFILTLHGGNLPLFLKKHPNRVKRLINSANAVTTPSEYLKSEFKEIRDNIILLRNAIDLSNYAFQHRSIIRPQLTWLRAFHSIYNPLLAAKTLSNLSEEFPEAQLTMFGPNKEDGSLQAMETWATNADILDRIHVVGSIAKSDVPHRLSEFDVFLNTTTAESFGVAVMEAAALGMCIVTTNVGELPFIWSHEQDALLVPPNDPEAMATTVRRILTEPELAERLSRNARMKAEQFDWSTILPQWEDLLENVIRGYSNGRTS